MSLRALRYTDPDRVADIGEVRKLGSPYRMTRHHIPPRCPDNSPRILKLDERRHRAYHLALGNPKDFHDAVETLRLTYWPMVPKGQYVQED